MCNGLLTEINFKGDTIMNYTSNHHLPQWSKADRILMDDFNAAMANIESGMNANAQAAAAAKSTANAANANANSARQEAAALPYATGAYVGRDADQVVNLGFRPSFVIITGILPGRNAPTPEYIGEHCCFTGPDSTIPDCLEITSTGFIAKKTDATYPDLVFGGRRYEYIAFK